MRSKNALGTSLASSFAKSPPSRSMKNAKNGASSSDGSHAAAANSVSPTFFCNVVSPNSAAILPISAWKFIRRRNPN